MSVALNGWHPGEHAMQMRVNVAEPMAMGYTWIHASMPEQHRVFYSRTIPFVPLTTLDAQGRPWVSLVSGGAGAPGFIESPSETELVLSLELCPGDPIRGNLELFGVEHELLTAGLGIEFPTRRRNKFAGRIVRVDRTGENSRRVRLRVNQAIGNCPKYINVRELEPHPQISPELVYNNPDLAPEERLPEEVIKFITRSDTVFFGTSYKADAANRLRFPSHVGMNVRGGRAGFVRVLPSDGRTVIMPDYSGNRLMTSLGNVEATPLASMSFLDFETGDTLYLTGMAKNYVGAEAQKIMPLQNVLTSLHVEGFVFIRDALPVRQPPSTPVSRSPYSPPIKLLAEEMGQNTYLSDDVSVTLTRIDILSPTLATFAFEMSAPVHVRPGQAAILDFTELLGAQQYAHMAPSQEVRINDDRMRTWTVSSAHAEGNGTRVLELTMRERPGGLVTGSLFKLVRHAMSKRPEILADARPLDLRVKLVGITGSFTLPEPSAEAKKLLWIVGGIGVTPFLSMLKSLAVAPVVPDHDIVLIISTREPDVLLRLVDDALQDNKALKIALHMFATQTKGFPLSSSNNAVTVVEHTQRFGQSGEAELSSIVDDVEERVVYLCGPPGFEKTAMDALSYAGIDSAAVVREGFGY